MDGGVFIFDSGWIKIADYFTLDSPALDIPDIGSEVNLDIPIDIRPAKVRIAEGSYRPSELGVYLDGVRWLNIGFCRYFPNDSVHGFTKVGEIAHAHVDLNGGGGEICMVDGSYVFTEPGMVDDVLIHEYCHILVPASVEKEGHTEPWKAAMQKFGLPGQRYLTYMYN